MNKEFDHEKAAKEDIAARPEVTGEGKEPEKKAAKEPLKVTSIQETCGPDELESSAGKVISKTLDELRVGFGLEKDEDFSRLLSETLSGTFAALRVMSGRPWVRFAIAGGAIAVSFVPPFMRYAEAKRQEKEKEKESEK